MAGRLSGSSVVTTEPPSRQATQTNIYLDNWPFVFVVIGGDGVIYILAEWSHSFFLQFLCILVIFLH